MERNKTQSPEISPGQEGMIPPCLSLDSTGLVQDSDSDKSLCADELERQPDYHCMALYKDAVTFVEIPRIVIYASRVLLDDSYSSSVVSFFLFCFLFFVCLYFRQ